MAATTPAGGSTSEDFDGTRWALHVHNLRTRERNNQESLRVYFRNAFYNRLKMPDIDFPVMRCTLDTFFQYLKEVASLISTSKTRHLSYFGQQVSIAVNEQAKVAPLSTEGRFNTFVDMFKGVPMLETREDWLHEIEELKKFIDVVSYGSKIEDEVITRLSAVAFKMCPRMSRVGHYPASGLYILWYPFAFRELRILEPDMRLRRLTPFIMRLTHCSMTSINTFVCDSNMNFTTDMTATKGMIKGIRMAVHDHYEVDSNQNQGRRNIVFQEDGDTISSRVEINCNAPILEQLDMLVSTGSDEDPRSVFQFKVDTDIENFVMRNEVHVSGAGTVPASEWAEQGLGRVTRTNGRSRVAAPLPYYVNTAWMPIVLGDERMVMDDSRFWAREFVHQMQALEYAEAPMTNSIQSTRLHTYDGFYNA